MNAIILAAVFAGAFGIIAHVGPEKIALAQDRMAQAEMDKGSMTHDVTVNAKTGEEEETNVIAFLDE